MELISRWTTKQSSVKLCSVKKREWVACKQGNNRKLDGKSTYDKIRTYFLGSNNVGLDLSTLRCLVPNSRLFASRAATERIGRGRTEIIVQESDKMKKNENQRQLIILCRTLMHLSRSLCIVSSNYLQRPLLS
jgi:hypothetical protein